jgi:hypothetical protein
MPHRIHTLFILFASLLTLPAWASSDSTKRIVDTLKYSLLVHPVSSHTFRQVIKREEFNQGLFQDPLQLIQGKTLGLWMIQPNGDPTGQLETYSPGFSSTALNSYPLIVIDGIPNRLLSSVHPQDIDSVVVLRDAAALRAYGSRGLNGVLLIATRKPQQGLAGIQVNYSAKTTVENPAHYQNLFSSDQWRQYAPRWPTSVALYDGEANTNWQREISRTVVNTDQLLTLSGALPKGDASLSVGYLTKNGVIKTTGLKRLTTRLDATYRWWGDRLKVVGSGWLTTSAEQPMPTALAQAVKEANPTIAPSVRNLLFPSRIPFVNPLSVLDSVRHDTHTNQQGYRVALYLTPVPNLLVSAQQTFNRFQSNSNSLDTRQKPASVDWIMTSGLSEVEKQRILATVDRVNAGDNYYSINLSTTDLALQYRLSFKRIGVTSWAHFTSNRDLSNLFVAQRLEDSGYWAYFLENRPSSTFTELGAGIDLSFYQKLFLHVAYRQENGSPTLSRRDNEDQTRFPIFSVRYQPISRLFAEYTWSKAEPNHASGIFLNSTLPNSLLDINRTPIPSYLHELFFQQVGRLGCHPKWGQLTLEYSHTDKHTRSLNVSGIPIGTRPLYDYTVQSRMANVQLDIDLLRRSDFTLQSSLIASYLTTKVNHHIPQYQPIIPEAIEPYSPFKSYYGYRIDQMGNTFKRQDQNGDGQFTLSDQTIIGQPYPSVTLGWSTYLAWKRLSVGLVWRASFGGSILVPVENSLFLSFRNWYKGFTVAGQDYIDGLIALRNNPTDPDAYSAYNWTNNLLLQSTNVVRLDNVSISYRFQFGSLPLRLDLFGQNLVRFSSYPGVDPERSFKDMNYGSPSSFYYKPRVIGLGLAVELRRP